MKKIDKRKQRVMTFGELSSGDVFYDIKGGFYIKTDCEDYNAVRLLSGSAVSFDERELVSRENATLFIGGEEE